MPPSTTELHAVRTHHSPATRPGPILRIDAECSAEDVNRLVLRYANAGVTKNEQAGESLQFVRFWKKRTGKSPAELVFDLQLTTYSELDREGIYFITLRRRSRRMLQQIYSQPDSAWRRISLPALTRSIATPKSWNSVWRSPASSSISTRCPPWSE
jgi:hypothetical protein